MSSSVKVLVVQGRQSKMRLHLKLQIQMIRCARLLISSERVHRGAHITQQHTSRKRQKMSLKLAVFHEMYNQFQPSRSHLTTQLKINGSHRFICVTNSMQIITATRSCLLIQAKCSSKLLKNNKISTIRCYNHKTSNNQVLTI